MGGVLDCHCHEIEAAAAQSTTLTAAQSTALTKPVQIKIIAPPSVYTIEAYEWETVLAVLEKAAPKLGLDKSDAPSLQLQSNNKPLAHELEIKMAGLYDGAECCVLGVEAECCLLGDRYVLTSRQFEVDAAKFGSDIPTANLIDFDDSKWHSPAA